MSDKPTVTLFTSDAESSIISTQNERSERAILLEQLNQWRATERQAKRNISNIESRLAELNQCQTVAA